MTKIDLLHVMPEKINFDLADLKNRLLPVMHQLSITRNSRELKEWATKKIFELRQGLSNLLPFDEHELLFINRVRNEGIIAPELITSDDVLSEKILSHPAINWIIKQRNT